MGMRSEAMKYIKHGWSVIPVKGKDQPLIEWKPYQIKFATESEVMSWPDNCNLAVVTGAFSNVNVIDTEKSALHLDLTSTLRVSTGRAAGGFHLYFKDCGIRNKQDLNNIKGLDIRGEGGYAILPPSIHPETHKRYKWMSNYLLPLPEFPKSVLGPTHSLDKRESVGLDHSPAWMGEVIDLIENGGPRRPSFLKLAGKLRYQGWDKVSIYKLLLPLALKVGTTEEQLEKICNDINKYEPTIKPFVNGCSITEFLADQQPVEWVVPNLIAKSSIGFVAGLPETLKTWLVIDLAIEATKPLGGFWLGKFPVNPVKVLFIDQERAKSETQRRFSAVIAAKKLKLVDLKDSLFIRSGTTTRIDLQHSYDAFKRELNDIKPDLVLIDSFATFHTKEENNRADIQVVLERLKELRAEFKCTFLFIDHENKGVFHDSKDEIELPSAMRMVGSVAKPAAAETILTVRKHSPNSSFVYHTKSTLSSTVEPFLVKVEDLTPDKSQIRVRAE